MTRLQYLEEDMAENTNKKSWEEFRECGMLWMINGILHMFGWAIVLIVDDGEVLQAYPARVKYRGFSEEVNRKGYEKVSRYMNETSEELLEEALS